MPKYPENIKKGILTALNLICFLFSSQVFAQNKVSVPTAYSFDAVSSEQDLPHYAAHHILQDSFGFIWISTRDGLCRFDGTTCRVFRKNDTKGLKLESNIIWLTFEDSKKRLWIGTKGGGLSYFNPGTNTSKVFMSDELDSLSLNNNIVTAIFEDSNRNVWIGTDGGGLSKIIESEQADSIHFKAINLVENHNEALAVLSIIETDDGKLWLATYGKGILVYDPDTGEIKAINSQNSLITFAGDYVMTLAKEDSVIWAGTKFGGISKFNTITNKITQYKHNPADPLSLPNNFVWDIFIDSSGNKWVGSYGGGLSLFPKNESGFFPVKNVMKQNSFTDNFVLHTMQDKQGQLWIATDNQGAFRFKTKPVFVPISMQWRGIDNTSNLVINDLFCDSSGRFWISTNSGLFTAGSDLEIASLMNPGLGTTIFYKVIEDENGKFWIASNFNLGHYNPESGIWNEIDIAGSLNIPGTDRFFDLEMDDNGILWLASDGGLIRLNPANNNVQLFQHRENDPSSISGNKLNDILIDGSSIWVATDDKGLSVFNINTNKAKSVKLRDYLPESQVSEYITDISKDYRGNIVIGTDDKGVYFIHRTEGSIDSIAYLSSGSNLHSSQIFDTEHYTDFMLITHRNGMTKWVGESSSTVNVKLPQEINDVGNKEIYRTGDATYFFSRDKIYQVYPEHINTAQGYPEIQVTGIELFNEPIRSGISQHLEEMIVLDYNQDFLTISYTTLNYDPNTLFPTEYLLEGHDPYWLEGGESESVNYTNLKPGEYTFKVRLAGGISTGNQVEIPIKINAPFWQTPWFRVMFFILAFVILYIAYKYHTYYLLKEEKTRTRIARDLHDDLSGTLSSISFFSEAAQRVYHNPDEAKRFLGMIDKSATEAKEKINDIIWAIDPTKDDWEIFLKKCKRFTADALDSREINYQLNIAEIFNVKVKLELRQNLWLIYKEIINNLAEHSGATEASIVFIETGQTIMLDVKDNGTGFDPESESSGNGIKNIRHRANLIGAELSLNTHLGNGTEWILKLNI